VGLNPKDVRSGIPGGKPGETSSDLRRVRVGKLDGDRWGERQARQSRLGE